MLKCKRRLYQLMYGGRIMSFRVFTFSRKREITSREFGKETIPSVYWKPDQLWYTPLCLYDFLPFDNSFLWSYWLYSSHKSLHTSMSETAINVDFLLALIVRPWGGNLQHSNMQQWHLPGTCSINLTHYRYQDAWRAFRLQNTHQRRSNQNRLKRPK